MLATLVKTLYTLFHTQKSIPNSTPKGLQTTVFGAAHTCIVYTVHAWKFPGLGVLARMRGIAHQLSVTVGIARVIRIRLI